MFSKKSKFIWLALIVWLIASISLFKFMPNMDRLILEKGQPDIPKGYSFKIANEYDKLFNGYGKNVDAINAILVFNSSSALSDNQKNSIEAGLQKLSKYKGKLGIIKITDPFSSKDLENQMISKDNTTVLVPISIDKANRMPDNIQTAIYSELKAVNVKYSLTGQEFINNANMKTTKAGVKKTEVFTIIIIFLILLVVFRSPVTPLVSLFTILLTYIASLGIVTQLVDKLNFPFSTITQSFLIMVLFGVGTDYNILLLSRFKEELINNPVTTAVKNTYKTAGKTVLFSAGTVLIGFGVLSFAKFSIYKAGSAVAIAVFILLLELFTLLPFFMLMLGKNMFLFNNKLHKHNENKLWKTLSSFSYARPIIAVILVLAITLPFVITYKDNVSYNMLKEIDPSYDAVKAANIISDKFGEGVAFPLTIYLKNNKAMNNNDALSAIDKLTDNLSKLPVVDKVYSVTRPNGDKISNLYVDEQTSSVIEGLNNVNTGLNNISSGLSDANSKLSSSFDISKLNQLLQGSVDINNNMNALNNGLQQVEAGISEGVNGSESLNAGITLIENSEKQINTASQQLSENYIQIYQTLLQLQDGYSQVASQAQGLQTAFDTINGYITALGKSQPAVNTDPSYIALKATTSVVSTKVSNLTTVLNSLNQNFTEILDSLYKANTGLTQITQGQQQIETGIESLSNGANSLTEGLEKANSGQTALLDSNKKLTIGMSQVVSGQETLNNGLNTLSSNINELKGGLTKSINGLNNATEGITSANDYLKKLSSSSSSKVFYIPEDKINTGDFKTAMDTYLSGNYEIAKYNVILKVDPYSQEGIDAVNSINNCVTASIKNTSLSDCSIGIGGTSSLNRDLKSVSSSDLMRTEILMLIGIGIILLVISKSLRAALAVLVSLILANYAAMFATNYIFSKVLKIGYVNWAIPFFSFIMIVALGVDYSIFLLMKVKENQGSNPSNAIVQAASNVGEVVISAAIILSGTFGALYPSQVPMLMELATSVIIGLILLVFLLLPLFIPAVITFKFKEKTDFK